MERCLSVSGSTEMPLFCAVSLLFALCVSRACGGKRACPPPIRSFTFSVLSISPMPSFLYIPAEFREVVRTQEVKDRRDSGIIMKSQRKCARVYLPVGNGGPYGGELS